MQETLPAKSITCCSRPGPISLPGPPTSSLGLLLSLLSVKISPVECVPPPPAERARSGY